MALTYKIRLGGTNEFVSEIDPHAPRCYPPGEVKFVEGWTNPDALEWKTKREAETAQNLIWDIEGYHTTIEE